MSDEPPRMATEPPAGYVAFVTSHLPQLRRDAATVVGDERDADLLYPSVLTDVALRWEYLRLLSTRLGRTGIAEEYLRHAFNRRSLQWQAQQDGDEVPVHVWSGDGPPPVTLEVGTDNAARSNQPRATDTDTDAPRQTSAAVRMASLFGTGGPVSFAPVAEAAIAWLHAHEVRKRYRLIAIGVLLLLFLAVLSHLAGMQTT